MFFKTVEMESNFYTGFVKKSYIFEIVAVSKFSKLYIILEHRIKNFISMAKILFSLFIAQCLC